MPEELLDTLVKLASLGASGVCIFAIFWLGWLIWRLPSDATREQHVTLRMFMIIAVIIAVISGGTGLVNAKFKSDELLQLKDDTQRLNSELKQYSEREIKTKAAAESLAKVLKSKEASNLENPSTEIQIHIDLLKEFLKDMGVEVTQEN